VKSNDTLQIKALSVNGQLMRAAQLDYVASLPTRHEALAMLARVTKAPVSKFVRTLAAPHAKLVRAFAAVRDKKQS
jgi:large subunit ribosomal protein L10